MEGIQYIVSEKGVRTGVIIDLTKYGNLWEDFHDAVLAKERENEPRESMKSVKETLIK